jgi:uncharacterized protein
MIVRPRPRRGLYEDRFWQHVNDRCLHLQQCQRCGDLWYPPGPACPSCNSEDWLWEPILGAGTLLSWVTFTKTYFPSVPAPYTVAACQIVQGPILLADTTADPESLRIGDRMDLCYYDAVDESSQSMTLYGWKPATS